MSDPSLDFSRVKYFATLSQDAYLSEEKIREKYPELKSLQMLDGINVQFFVLETDEKQVVVVRGTANLANAREDMEYLQTFNQKLDIFLHAGFNEDTDKVYQALIPHLNDKLPVEVTGHSLGAAIATILMMHMHVDGYDLLPSMNFGQPKLTNKKGVAKFLALPMLRIIDENDVVPVLPATTLLDSIHGEYHHLGDAVILLEGEYFVYLTHAQQHKEKASSFWWNMNDVSVKAHFMEHYQQNISPKLKGALPVAYDNREKYIKHNNN